MQMSSLRDRFIAFAFAAADLLVETDQEGVITFAAGAARQFAGCEGDMLVGQLLADIIHHRDRRLLNILIDDAPKNGRNGPICISNSDCSAAGQLSLLKLGDNRLHFAISTASESGNPLAHADRDDETGLLLPSAFEKLAEQQLLRSLEADYELELSILRIVQTKNEDGDVDHESFKHLFEHVAVLLRMLSLGSDAATMVAPGQFAVLHANDGSGREIKTRVEAALGHEHQLESQNLKLSEQPLPPSQACDALRHVLNSLGNGDIKTMSASSLSEALDLKISHTLTRVKTARQQIERQEFEIAYQPIVSLENREIHHFEALSRFRDGSSPFEFVTFAEHVGFITEFDLTVAKRVLGELRSLAGRGERPIVAVNLSARSLENDIFIDALRDLCRSARPESAQLMFEVTESCEIRDLSRTDSIIQKLRKDGHHICLDDFGAGSAALHYIRALTVDYVKLDGDYVRRMLVNERDSSILGSMISLCAQLEVSTIAEMVEREEQAEALTVLGANFAQGWLFGKAESLLTANEKSIGYANRMHRKIA